MKVAEGKEVYWISAKHCLGIGYQWSDEQLQEAMDGHVTSVLFDDAGKADVRQLLCGLVDAEFDEQRIADILTLPEEVENWQVGEAIAAAYLTDHRNCLFPWPVRRDERKSGSSPSGPDLVGICADDKGDRLAFGEVKTSSEARHPPRVMSDLELQLKCLRDRYAVRGKLLVYLASRANNADWKARFRGAVKRFVANGSDVHIFGFLVRDMEPDIRDLKACVSELALGCVACMNIEVLVLYLPYGSVSGLAELAVSKRRGSIQ